VCIVRRTVLRERENLENDEVVGKETKLWATTGNETKLWRNCGQRDQTVLRQ
jgi:hypothetical protein